MIRNEGELASNVQTLRDKCDGKFESGTCQHAFTEVMDFMKAGGKLQEQLATKGLLQLDGNSLNFSETLYPTADKSK